MKITIRLLIILTFMQATVAGAESVFTAELKQFTLGLIDKGVPVGDFDLKEFYSDLDKIEWHVTDQPFAKPAVDAPGVTISFGPDGGLVATQGVRIPERQRINRVSGRYAPYTVSIGADVANAKPSKARTQTLFHEACGALKSCGDHHSAQSSAIMLIDQYPILAPTLGDDFFNAKTLEDGGSSVGGGGNFGSFDLKQRVLNHILSGLKRRSKPVTAEFLSNYAAITFEPMDEPQNQRVMIMYKFNRKGLFGIGKPKIRGVRQDRPYEELTTVLFPRKHWTGDSAENRMLTIQKISFGILSIFPTARDQTETGPDFIDCKGNSFRVPKKRDFSAGLVLHFRANMIANCEPFRLTRPNEVGFEVFMTKDALR